MKHFVFAQVSFLLAFAVFPLDGANLSCGTQQFPAVHFWNSLDCCFLLSLKVSVCKAGKVVHLL